MDKLVTICLRVGLALILMPSATWGQVSTVQQTVKGCALNLIVPDGYCVLDVDSVMGKEWYAFQEKLIEGRGAVIFTFASCAEVEKRKTDPEASISNHGAYVTIFPYGATAAVPPGFTREQTVVFIGSTIPRLSSE